MSNESTMSTQCGWCRTGEPQEPGAHHAADCSLYRSPFVGPEAERWDRELRERLAKSNLPSWVPEDPVTVTLSPYEIACIGWWWNAASWESKAEWGAEEIKIFAKLGVTKEPGA